jgi:hypothetical protein
MEDWKNKFKMYLFGPNPESMNIEAAVSIIKKYIPKRLFKYTRVSCFSIKNLNEDTLLFNAPENFDDPYDSSMQALFDPEFERDCLIEKGDLLTSLFLRYSQCLSRQDVDKINKSNYPPSEIIRILKEKDKLEDLAEDIDAITESFDQTEICEIGEAAGKHFHEEIRNYYKVSCLSEKFNSMPMWDHYANNHQGFVMEYNFSEVGNYSFMPFPIIYDKERFNPLPYVREYCQSGNRNDMVGIAALIHKAKDWSYENEWRLIVSNNQKSTEHSVHKVPTPKAIYLGSKMKPTDILCLKHIAIEKEIPIFKMKLSKSSYELHPVLIKNNKNIRRVPC